MVVSQSKVVLLMILGFVSACSSGGGDGSDSGGNTSTNTISVVSINPPPIFLRNDSTITITFNQSIDTTISSWQISGDLASESDGGVWSSSVIPNDTLTISPSVTWTAKPGRSIIFDATDLGGNVVASFALNYDIYRGTLYYVDSSMSDDTGDGLSPATARKYIHTAVADAVQPATVLVNTGNYLVNYALSTHVVLRDGVSIYGGYRTDFGERNSINYPTIIEDVSADPGAPANYKSAIVADGNADIISPSTLVDGFIIKGSTQPNLVYATAIMLDGGGASPTFNNNRIIGPDTISPVATSAFMIGNSSPVVSNNIIYGGNSPLVAGVLIGYFGEPKLFNNIIHGGNSANISVGVAVWGASPVIRNNTIYSGQSDSLESGILIQSDDIVPFSYPSIDNNIIFSTSEQDSFCLMETYAQLPTLPGTISPVSLHNNNMFSCNTMYQDIEAGCAGNADGDNNSLTCTLDELNALSNVISAVGNNVSFPAEFVDMDGVDDDLNTMGDNDWHLSASSPTGITAGGLNGYDQIPTWSFTTDADGNNRPASGNPWSIGSYELR